jgi:hypothetical protein
MIRRDGPAYFLLPWSAGSGDQLLSQHETPEASVFSFGMYADTVPTKQNGITATRVHT